MKKDNTTISISLGWFFIVGIVLVVLKLLRLINISWVWVLAPLWIPIPAFIFICVLTTCMVYFIRAILSDNGKR